ncbi:MAG TPA: DUF3558 family protein [Actinophytocola sp.]|jgi:hypothetical protein|uniref:DUF3558 family protein n=1 Tax=Actinophytocola sp. TaxID=1872138 RepID=UPI002E0CEB71|nr:DUF3558 family protein [Actinophytocola sp.]
MPRQLLVLLLALAACGTPEAPTAGGRVTPSLGTSPPRAVASPGPRATANPRAYLEFKPCELISADEAESFGLTFPGTPQKRALDFGCAWTGTEFATTVTMGATPLAAFEETAPAKRKITIAGRRAALVRYGGDEYPGLCDVTLDVTRIAVLDVLLVRYDHNEGAACLEAIKLATLLHPRLPGA